MGVIHQPHQLPHAVSNCYLSSLTSKTCFKKKFFFKGDKDSGWLWDSWKPDSFCSKPSKGVTVIFFALSCVLYIYIFLAEDLISNRPTKEFCLWNPLILHADGMLMNSLLCILSSSGQICDIIFQNKTGLGSWFVGFDENWVTKLKNISPNTTNLLRAAAKHSIKTIPIPSNSPQKRLFDFFSHS